MALACCVALGGSPVAAARQAEPVMVPVSSLSRSAADVEVFVEVNASPEQVTAVEQAITMSGFVERYAHLDKSAAYEEFKALFASQPDLIATVKPADLPESFRLDLAPHVTRAEAVRRFGHLAGVNEVQGRRRLGAEELRRVVKALEQCNGPITTIEVFMNVRATAEQVTAVEQAIAAIPSVVRYRHLDKQDALEEFRRIFRKKKDLVQTITAADLPESFRVHLPRDDAGAMANAFRALPGVNVVETAGSGLCGAGATTTSR